MNLQGIVCHWAYFAAFTGDRDTLYHIKRVNLSQMYFLLLHIFLVVELTRGSGVVRKNNENLKSRGSSFSNSAMLKRNFLTLEMNLFFNFSPISHVFALFSHQIFSQDLNFCFSFEGKFLNIPSRHPWNLCFWKEVRIG